MSKLDFLKPLAAQTSKNVCRVGIFPDDNDDDYGVFDMPDSVEIVRNMIRVILGL